MNLSQDEIINDLVGDLWRRRIIGEMSRDELRNRVSPGPVNIEAARQAHLKAEEIVKKHMQEKLGVEEQKQGYPRSLKQHPQQRILIGNTII